MPESDRDYFARRAREERAAATRAASEDARASHADLAEPYAELASALEAAGEDIGDGARSAIISRVSIDAERRTKELLASPTQRDRGEPPADDGA